MPCGGGSPFKAWFGLDDASQIRLNVIFVLRQMCSELDPEAGFNASL